MFFVLGKIKLFKKNRRSCYIYFYKTISFYICLYLSKFKLFFRDIYPHFLFFVLFSLILFLVKIISLYKE